MFLPFSSFYDCLSHVKLQKGMGEQVIEKKGDNFLMARMRKRLK